jgi:cytochrome c553
VLRQTTWHSLINEVFLAESGYSSILMRQFISLLFIAAAISGVSSVIAAASDGIPSSKAAPATPVNVPDTMAERVKPCTVCHGQADRVGKDAYYPRIAGKPEGYLFNQLRDFRDGRRYYRPMTLLLANVSDEYLREMAAYFSGLRQPYPPPEQGISSPTEIRQAQKLVQQGDAMRDIPACIECHGKQLMGTAPFIPGLLGLPRIYIAAQFGAWKNGGVMRGQESNCMSDIARQLTIEETNVVAAWLAAQPVPENAGPADVLPPQMAQRCGSIVQRSADR